MRATEARSKRLVWPWPVDGPTPRLADWLRLVNTVRLSSGKETSRNPRWSQAIRN